MFNLFFNLEVIYFSTKLTIYFQCSLFDKINNPAVVEVDSFYQDRVSILPYTSFIQNKLLLWFVFIKNKYLFKSLYLLNFIIS